MASPPETSHGDNGAAANTNAAGGGGRCTPAALWKNVSDKGGGRSLSQVQANMSQEPTSPDVGLGGDPPPGELSYC